MNEWAIWKKAGHMDTCSGIKPGWCSDTSHESSVIKVKSDTCCDIWSDFGMCSDMYSGICSAVKESGIIYIVI